MQLRDGQWEECGDQDGLLLRPDDNMSEFLGKFYAYVCADQLTGEPLVVSFHGDKKGCGIAYAHSIPLTCQENENGKMLLGEAIE